MFTGNLNFDKHVTFVLTIFVHKDCIYSIAKECLRIDCMLYLLL